MGLIKTAIYGGAGYYAFNKIMKSVPNGHNLLFPNHIPSLSFREDTTDSSTHRHREEKHQSASQAPAPQTSRQFDTQSQQYQNGYGYQYQPQPLQFQAASEHLRGQHIRVDQNGDSYFTHPHQRMYLAENAPQPAFYQQPTYYQQPAPRYQSGFVKEINEPVSAGKN
ncbi:hypothetical protein H2198_004553 [Neophaeococcomyces mojaviensis]|uniref:Uncharacterized protein n=1 Tax=Neophaeococcomyces mojaviensis TaxID=3383035 RepID=A0ACC3A8I2_9EURO|nr:hypothetical protein H2198_004553 [Knufia sp. JES_112]